jgi:protocatechuate 3,4-dioxygenase alpha subunit
MTDVAGLTPSQTVGPYLSIGLLGGPIGTELVPPSDPRAIRIRGQVLDGSGDSVPDGIVEIWQADAAGRYGADEDGFTGFGRCGTAGDGWFSFTTLKPGRVPARNGGLQAPHLAVGVFARGLLKRVVTRMYFPDEEAANAEDPVLSALDLAQRASLVARADGEALRFDIRLQGDAQTTFFAV